MLILRFGHLSVTRIMTGLRVRIGLSVLFLAFFVQLLSAAVVTSPSISELIIMNETPLPVLFKKAQSFYDTRPDSAIIYYTAASDRYSTDLSKESKEICLNATLDRWELVFFNYFDYTSALESLSKAKEISADIRVDEPRIDLYYGCMYHTIFGQTNDIDAGHKAFDYFIHAFESAINNENILVTRISFGNLLEVASTLGRLGEIKEYADTYRSVSDKYNWPGRDFDIGLYEAELCNSRKDYERSGRIFTDLIMIADSMGHERYKLVALQGLISSCINGGQFNRALDLINDAESSLASSSNMRDGLLMLHNLKAVCYDSIGDISMSRKSLTDYILLKDSLMNYNQAAVIKSTEFIDEIREFDRRLNESKQKRHRLIGALAVSSLFLIFVGGAWLKLRRKNIALENANKSLYKKNLELLILESDASKRREVDKNLSEIKENNTHQYKGYTVTDDMRESLWQIIVDTLDHSEEIYNPEFSLNRLAELCDSKPKYVSQVINEKGENFKTFINTYRIRQACREFSMSSNLTIEAVANNVGFKSGNAFRSSFKRITGLTPSDYIRMARQERDKNTQQSDSLCADSRICAKSGLNCMSYIHYK